MMANVQLPLLLLLSFFVTAVAKEALFVSSVCVCVTLGGFLFHE